MRPPTAPERERLIHAENTIFRGFTTDINSPDFSSLALMLGEGRRWILRLQVAILRAICRRSTYHRVKTEWQLRLAQCLWNWRECRRQQAIRGY